MLHQIAITPDVFLSQGYDSQELCDACTEGLHTALLEWCLICDLRAGGWKKALRERMNDMPFRTRELWKSLMKSGRLKTLDSIQTDAPVNDQAWCNEALEVHRRKPYLGILASSTTKKAFQNNSVVASVQSRSTSDWWRNLEAGHPDGPTTHRKLSDYQARLRLLLHSANSLIFIDPHLDPQKRNYSQFLEMIRPALERSSIKPTIEIHRCCSEGAGRESRIIDASEWEQRFKDKWQTTVRASGAQLQVFIWSEFHDRYLISNLLGIHVGNGFDTTNDVNKRVTWSRMNSRDKDMVQRLFDPRYQSERLKHQFVIR